MTLRLPLVVAALVIGAWAALVAQRMDAFVDSRHHPAIAYGRGAMATPLVSLNERLARGELTLPFDPATGYLRATLEALDIPVASQVLVYSPTSFQASHITERNPRAIYFSDTVAVAWIRGADLLEVTAQDARHGTLFYTLGQQPATTPQFNRQEQCVSCHLTWDTLGVPGLTVRSTRPRTSTTQLVEGVAVDHTLTMAERWGGWFVTGARVPARHLGNAPLVRPGAATIAGETPRLTDVGVRFDTAGYLRETSDIVALLILEHQAHAANLITRLEWETRLGDGARMQAAAEALADYLLFVGEAPLDDAVEGNAGFAEAFTARGPHDRRGRSLRDLGLNGRLMRYPLSYMVYTPMFNGLSPAASAAVIERLAAVLSGGTDAPKYGHLTPADRQAVREIVGETHPTLAAALDRPMARAPVDDNW